jgi:hypothetical protein
MTRYEIAARHPNGHKLLIGYTPHKSRPGLLATVQKHEPEINAVLGIGGSEEIIIETQHRIVATSTNGASSSQAAQKCRPEGKASYSSLRGIITAIPRRARRRCRRCAVLSSAALQACWMTQPAVGGRSSN